MPGCGAGPAAAVSAASRACWRWRSRASTRADSSAAVVFLRLASWSTSALRCALASATTWRWAAAARSASALRSAAVAAASSAARLASAAASVRDCAAVAAFSADSKARARPAVTASSVAASSRARPEPLTKLLRAGFRPPLRYRSPASWPSCLRVLACSAPAAAALAAATAAASRRVASSTRASPYALFACRDAARLVSWPADASARSPSILVTSAAVELALDLAAAISSGEGISGDAGTRPAVSSGGRPCAESCEEISAEVSGAAWAGSARVPRRTTAVQSTAVLRPDRIQLMGNLAEVSGWSERGRIWRVKALCGSPSRHEATCQRLLWQHESHE